VTRFGATLDHFECGALLQPCSGTEGYHRRGLPNDGWISFHWSNYFLRRFSLALEFSPYLPGRSRIIASGNPSEVGEQVSLSVASAQTLSSPVDGIVGEVLASSDGMLTVQTREGTARCLLRGGPLPSPGALLLSGRPPDSDGGAACAHPIDAAFTNDVLPIAPYICSTH